jgi:hypothetical protein
MHRATPTWQSLRWSRPESRGSRRSSRCQSIEQDPGGWTDEQRERAGVVRLPTNPQQQEDALLASPRVREALGEPLVGAFVAVRRADARWAKDRAPEEVVSAHLWRYWLPVRAHTAVSGSEP